MFSLDGARGVFNYWNAAHFTHCDRIEKKVYFYSVYDGCNC